MNNTGEDRFLNLLKSMALRREQIIDSQEATIGLLSEFINTELSEQSGEPAVNDEVVSLLNELANQNATIIKTLTDVLAGGKVGFGFESRES